MCRKKILLTGGAGFIGSHINQVLIESGYQTVIIDNLCNSRKITNTKAIFMPGDLRSSAFLTKVFTKYNFEAVIHLAAHIDVGESFLNPNKYYNHNVLGSINLLNFMLKHQVLKLIFSSSAAVYGHPQSSIITEQHPLKPISPYGKSKLIIENILEDLAISHSLKYCSLRYFNAAGGDPAGNLKNYQKKPSNLIPILIYAVKERIPQISIFGDDHSTKDGTCVRDYIHVHDLAIAHKKALEKIIGSAVSQYYNLGTGNGYSIYEVIQAVEKVSGKKINFKISSKRQCDPASLVASGNKAKLELFWQPKYVDLLTMVEHAWNSLDHL